MIVDSSGGVQERDRRARAVTPLHDAYEHAGSVRTVWERRFLGAT